MYYLKCNSCGHLNKFDNENLLFCDKCNKKLENNFRDWQKINSENSIEEFRKLVCISEEEIPKNNSSKKKTKRKSLKYWIGFALTFAIFYAGGKIGGEKLVSLFKSEKTSQEILSQEWFSETYGNFGLVVETPVIMTERELPIPDQVKEVIEEMQAFEYASAKGFKVYINSVKYKPVIEEISLQGVANGSVNEMRMQKGVTNFEYTEDEILLNGISGFKQIGKFDQNDIAIEFINTGYVKGMNMWQVMVAYELNDEVGKVAAKRVIESVNIENI